MEKLVKSKSEDNYKLARQLSLNSRYINDISVVNYLGFGQIAEEIYHTSLLLELAFVTKCPIVSLPRWPIKTELHEYSFDSSHPHLHPTRLTVTAPSTPPLQVCPTCPNPNPIRPLFLKAPPLVSLRKRYHVHHILPTQPPAATPPTPMFQPNPQSHTPTRPQMCQPLLSTNIQQPISNCLSIHHSYLK